MKIEIPYAQVVGKETAMQKNVQVYYIEVTDGKQYVSVFRLKTKDPAIAAVCTPGSTVNLQGYGDGRKLLCYRNAQGIDVPYKFPRYETWFTISKALPVVQVKEGTSADGSEPSDAAIPLKTDGIAEDIPF